jgi:transcriptional antiterminator RfaH
LPRQETRAEIHLLRQGYRAFLPIMTKTVRHARKLRTVRAPVFPGYLFVALDLHRDRWRSVNGTMGVSSLIMAESAPLPAPHGVVERLLDCVDESGAARFDRDLQQGEAIRVLVGPFANALGSLDRLDANGRVKVLLEIMGGKVTALLDRAALARA